MSERRQRRKVNTKKESNLLFESKLKGSQGVDLDLTSELTNNNISSLHTQAESVIEFILSGTIPVGRLTQQQKDILFFYMYKFSPYIGRILDLHVSLPLSSLRLQKPTHEVDIVQDYIFEFFDELMTSKKFKNILQKVVLNYWLFGEGIVIIEDDYDTLRDTIIDEYNVDTISTPTIKPEDVERIDKINSQYNTDPELVSVEDKIHVLEKYLLNINKNYKKPKNIRVLGRFDVEDVLSNPEIDYYVYKIPKSPFIVSYLGKNTTLEEDKKKEYISKLYQMGYSEAYVRMHTDSNENSISLDNDPFSDGVYLARMYRESIFESDNSILNRLIDPAIKNLAASRRSNERINLANKIDRIVKAPGASEAQINMLKEDLVMMAEAEDGNFLVTAFDLNIEEVKIDISEQLDFGDILERTTKEMLISLGMPEEMISGGESYGTGFIKTELLTQEYLEFRNTIKQFIEEQIFRPIAIKKGFFTKDAWGNVTPLYPTVRFDRFSISRQSEDFAQLSNLVEAGKLPAKVLYDLMGLDQRDIEQQILKEKKSILNPAMSDVIQEAISQLSESLANNVDFRQAFLENALKMDVTESQPANPDLLN